MKEVFDPLIQAKRQQKELGKWLADHKIHTPIEYLVVISNPSTVIKTSSYHKLAIEKVLHASHLRDRIDKLKENYPAETLTDGEIRKLSRAITKKHIPANCWAPGNAVIAILLIRKHILEPSMITFFRLVPPLRISNFGNSPIYLPQILPKSCLLR